MKNPLKALYDLLTLPQRLKEEFQQKISEAHLHIKTGEVSPGALDAATETLKEIRDRKMKIL